MYTLQKILNNFFVFLDLLILLYNIFFFKICLNALQIILLNFHILYFKKIVIESVSKYYVELLY